jgi:5-methylthioadenosine/S-adenosylhomocysteine deaminase
MFNKALHRSSVCEVNKIDFQLYCLNLPIILILHTFIAHLLSNPSKIIMAVSAFNNKEQDSEKIIVIKNAMILSIDKDFNFWKSGSIVIRGRFISAIGELTEEEMSFPSATVIDGKGKLVMPGLINTHTHVPMTIFRGYADDLPLHQWLYEYIFPIESEFINAGNVKVGAKLAIAEMLRSGTTTFNDMYYFVDEIAQVAESAGIRAVLSESVIDFPVPNSPTPQDSLRLSEKLINKWKDHSLVTISISAHSPYSCSGKLIQDAKALADKYGVPFNMHVAETRKEFDESMQLTGLTPTAYLQKLGILGPNVIFAHGVHLTADDIEILAANGVSVAHNPECNMKLASGVAPVPQLLRAGVKVGFGTDGVASNNNLDLFEEMNTAAILHKLNSNDPTVLNARTVVEMATMGGARLLGKEKEIGSLEVGKKADLIVLDMMQPHAHPVYNIYSILVYSMQGSDVETVIVDGKIVMLNRKLTLLDVDGLYEETECIAGKIKERSIAMADIIANRKPLL